MNFSNLVLDKLNVIFARLGFYPVSQSDNYLRLESQHFVIIIAHDPLDLSNTLWVGRVGEKVNKIEINNQLLATFFRSDLRIEENKADEFLKHVSLFLEREGNQLFNSNLAEMRALEEFDNYKNHLYNLKLQEKQYFDLADKAWNQKNYSRFLKYLNEINSVNWPPSYELKYKIAKNEIQTKLS